MDFSSFSDAQITVIFDALEMQMDHARHYPEKVDNIDTSATVYEAVWIEARKRKIIY